MNLFFDTETTGIPKNYNAPVSDVDNYPRLVQLGFIVMDGKETLGEWEYIVRPEGFEIPVEASNIHKITTEKALSDGIPIKKVILQFMFWMNQCDAVVGHNVDFDTKVVGAEYYRIYGSDPFLGKKTVCTMKSSVDFCKIPKANYSFRVQYKYPKLSELYKALFGTDMGAAHTALQDIQNTATCYFALVERGVIKI